MSWASIAKAQPKPSAGSSNEGLTAREGLRLLVVDANAIIDGVKLEGIADRALTIQEVLDEIRDKQSRQYLASLPYELEVSEPSEESIQAGKHARMGPIEQHFMLSATVLCSEVQRACKKFACTSTSGGPRKLMGTDRCQESAWDNQQVS